MDSVILVVAADRKARRLLTTSLEALSYSVFEADSAEQAHVVLGHLKPSPDLVLADPATSKALRNDPRVLRLIVISTDRPFTLQQLEQRVAEALEPR